MTLRHLVACLSILGFLAAGCGDDGPLPFPYAHCGNGTIEPGENCDDGPPASNNCDTCRCTSICQLAWCGDGFVQAGVEECDTHNLNRQTCFTLGYSGGTLRCLACRFDISDCGPAFTPTPVRTPTPTPTPTPSPRPTPTPGGECVPAGQVPVTVNFTAAGGNTSAISVVLAYPADAVGLPATGIEGRIANRPSGTVLRDVSAAAARLSATVTRLIGTFPQGRLFVVTFDRCLGGPPPVPADFVCEVTQCAAAPCTCSVALP